LARPGALRRFERRRQPRQLVVQAIALALQSLYFLRQLSTGPFKLRVVATQSRLLARQLALAIGPR
jgi:hypothetical protein